MRSALVVLLTALGAAFGASAQQSAAPAAPSQTYSAGQLEQLVAPIALYPDALLSQVLMASTYPSDVALAAAWAKAHQGTKGDDAVKQVENEPWDPSVQSLVAFPQVLSMMAAKPDWVQDLGDAFLADANGVMDAVQRLRAKAQANGSLSSNQQQTVSSAPAPAPAQPPPAGAPPPPTTIIKIEPANPQVVYVPSYNPTVVYGAWGYPAYPPYYIPYPPGWGFVAGAVTAGIAWGVGIGVTNALWGGVNWGGGGNQVNINVNKYNNINVHNRINNNTWNHNTNNRNGVPYRDRGRDIPARYNNDHLYSGRGTPGANGQRPGQNPQRDAERQRAEQQLSGRVGQQNMNRQALGNVDHNTLQNRGTGGQYGGGTRDFNNMNNQRDRGNTDNAFRGAGNAQQTREQMNRGQQSRQAMDQHRAQPQRAAERPQARPQQSHPQVQRGGGGGGRPAGGGGGGRAGGGGHRR